jgi:hypothetical protein
MKQLVLRSYASILLTFGGLEILQGWRYATVLRAHERPLLEELTNLPDKHRGPKVNFRDFNGKAEHHNTTIDGRPLPGSFLDDKLYLMGARLTTSYEIHDDSVYITLLGLPGRAADHRVDHCQSQLSRNVSDIQIISSTFQLFLQLECEVESSGLQKCGSPIQMEQIETLSWDDNVNSLVVIWQADVSKLVSRGDLVAKSRTSENAADLYREKSVRLHFWANYQSTLQASKTSLQPFISADIPLSTGVVGNAGPQIRNKPRPSQTKESPSNMHPAALVPSYIGQPSIGASLCVAAYVIIDFLVS